MSWQTYVDDQLLKKGIHKAAILGQQGGVWATSKEFDLTPAEQKATISAFSNPSSTQASGVRLGNEKYFTLSANDRSVYGKKGPDGCVIVKTKQAVLVAIYVAPVQQPQAVTVVEALADYLISVGY